MEYVEQLLTEKVGSFHTNIYHCSMLQLSSYVAYCIKNLNVRVSGSNPTFSVFLFISLLFFLLYFTYSFIYYYYYSLLAFYDFSLLVSGVRVRRLCWVGQGPVVLAAGGRHTNLDNGRARAYCVCSRCEFGSFRYIFFLSLIISLFFLPLYGMDGWMIWDFTSFSTEFK